MEKLHSDSYTDFVLFGGDGLFSLFVNALKDHPLAAELLKIPIALMPAGNLLLL